MSYPPYANGPGYIVTADIAKFVRSEFENNKLRVRCIFCYVLKWFCMIFFYIIYMMLFSVVVQNGRCEYGVVGRAI